MMAIELVGGGTQWRAYCFRCDIGLNWYNDAYGKESACRFTARRNEALHPASKST